MRGGTKKRVPDGWGLDNVVILVCSGCGDPHFNGLDGRRYHYHGSSVDVNSLNLPGIAGHRFAIISDSFVQMNSEFLAARGRKTYMGPTCIRVCKDTARFYPNGTIFINDELQPSKQFSARVSTLFSVSRRYTSTLVNFGNWSAVINAHQGSYFNFGNMRHYAPRLSYRLFFTLS